MLEDSGKTESSRQSDAAENTSTIPSGLDAIRQAAGTASDGSSRKPLLHNDGEEHTVVHVANSPGRLSRTLLNFWLDVALAIVFVVLFIISVIVQFVFPPGVAARGASLWGLTYGQWCSLQFGFLALLALGILVHVMLHWIWVCSVIAKRVFRKNRLPDDGIRTIYGVGVLITLLLIGAAAVGVAQWMIVLPD